MDDISQKDKNQTDKYSRIHSIQGIIVSIFTLKCFLLNTNNGLIEISLLIFISGYIAYDKISKQFSNSNSAKLLIINIMDVIPVASFLVVYLIANKSTNLLNKSFIYYSKINYKDCFLQCLPIIYMLVLHTVLPILICIFNKKLINDIIRISCAFCYFYCYWLYIDGYIVKYSLMFYIFTFLLGSCIESSNAKFITNSYYSLLLLILFLIVNMQYDLIHYSYHLLLIPIMLSSSILSDIENVNFGSFNQFFAAVGKTSYEIIVLITYCVCNKSYLQSNPSFAIPLILIIPSIFISIKQFNRKIQVVLCLFTIFLSNYVVMLYSNNNDLDFSNTVIIENIQNDNKSVSIYTHQFKSSIKNNDIIPKLNNPPSLYYSDIMCNIKQIDNIKNLEDKKCVLVIGDTFSLQLLYLLKPYSIQRNMILQSYTVVSNISSLKEEIDNLFTRIFNNRNIELIITLFADSEIYSDNNLVSFLSNKGKNLIILEPQQLNSNYSCYNCLKQHSKHCYFNNGIERKNINEYNKNNISNIHIIDIFRDELCYNSVCSCVIDNTQVYDEFGRLTPFILMNFYHKTEEYIDNIINFKDELINITNEIEFSIYSLNKEYQPSCSNSLIKGSTDYNILKKREKYIYI